MSFSPEHRAASALYLKTCTPPHLLGSYEEAEAQLHREGRSGSSKKEPGEMGAGATLVLQVHLVGELPELRLHGLVEGELFTSRVASRRRHANRQ